MMVIKIPGENRAKYAELFIKDKQRLACSTAVCFIEPNIIAVAEGTDMRLYLIRIDFVNGTHEILDKIDTTYNNEFVMPDLMDFDGRNLLVTSYFQQGAQSIYKIHNHQLIHVTDVEKMQGKNQRCHGATFFPFRENTICITGNKIFTIEFKDFRTNQKLYEIKYEDGFAPKDVAFVNENKMLVLYSTSKVLYSIDEKETLSRVLEIDFDLEKKIFSIISHIDIPNMHGDCIIYHKGMAFTSDQFGSKIHVMKLEKIGLSLFTSLDNFNLPHGVGLDPVNNLLAVTNYGDNSVVIQKIPEEIVREFN